MLIREQRRKFLRFIQSLENPEQYFQANRFALAIGEKTLSSELVVAYHRATAGQKTQFRLDPCKFCYAHSIHDTLCPHGS